MDIIIRTGFEHVKHSINFTSEAIRKAILLVQSKHVYRVEEKRSNGIGVIQSFVIRQTSVTSPPYKVQLEFNAERQITDVTCTCVANASKKCKHVCALIYYINTDRSLSKTTYEQEWGKPSPSKFGQEKYSKGVRISELFPLANKKVKVAAYEPTLLDLPNPCPLRSFLLANNKKAEEHFVRIILSDILSNALKLSEEINCQVCVENLFCYVNDNVCYNSSGCILNSNYQKFYDRFIVLSETDIIDLCKNTIIQSKSPLWFSARYSRISASSKTHLIKSSRKPVFTLINEMLNKNNIQRKSLMYGVKHEEDAIIEYERKYKVKVINIGVLISKNQPWLCASPDGIVIENGIIKKNLEIKCPSSCKEKPIIDKINNKCNLRYLHYNNGYVELNPNDKYYTQCQIQMYVTGLSECDLYIWSPKGSECVQINRDEIFLEHLIPKCEQFYFQYYLPALLKSNEEIISPLRTGDNNKM